MTWPATLANFQGSGSIRFQAIGSRNKLHQNADAKLSLGGWAARRMWKDQTTYYATADALVAAKASVNAKDETGFSPLAIAVLNENTSAVKKLLALNATVDEAVMNSAQSQVKVGTAEAGNIIQLLKGRSKR